MDVCEEKDGRKEGRNIARQKRRHSECNPRTDCFQILMSRDLLYPRRVRWSERELRRLREPLPTPPPSIAILAAPRRATPVRGNCRQAMHRCGRTGLSELDCKIFRGAQWSILSPYTRPTRKLRREKRKREKRTRGKHSTRGGGWCVDVNGDGWLCGSGG